MKQSRLDELMNKEQLSTTELGEICGSILQSLSRHSNDIKNKLKDLEKRIEKIEEKTDGVYNFQPAFGVISDLEEEEPDQE